MIYGYIRVSSDKQTVENQRFEINNFCEKNEMSLLSIYSKIRYYSRKEEYSNLSDEELVKFVIEQEFSPNVKYKYKGMKLSDYCKCNGLNHNTILSRVYQIKEEMKTLELSDEELVDIAINHYTPKKIVVRYKGELLKKYCEDRGYYYNRILSRFKEMRKKEENNGLSDDEIIEKVLAYNGGRDNFKKKSIRTICEENNLNVHTIASRIKKMKPGRAFYDNFSHRRCRIYWFPYGPLPAGKRL